MVFGGFDEEFDVVDGAFEVGAEPGESAVEVVVGGEANDGDGKSAGGGDEGFGDAAGHFAGGELFVADEAEGAHDSGDGPEKPEERREGDEGSQDPLEALASFQLVGGAQLHGSQGGRSGR